ncbi:MULTISPECIES: hypothetical protein [unclassified Oceanispirochaeta]|uniref:hypothetical protein n=1 Tax=unclassified Oceanispirochaeta TaxID=2635722 RepID=UPI000E097E6A|nr:MULTISPECIES: hypothetical protein [unclassified Oceanispirochaeta]MBF9018639.1 hypothetical protein [Oceanispirochaeta sp. M2]NPD75076.1 hypothetical protein [Oceanispirochaeta sp. M1]RDG29063.1 hypothetical protein DV872_23550 [Oceanispirochaeta sp. M1]
MKPAYFISIVFLTFILSGCREIVEDETVPLTYWVELHPEAAKIMKSYNENEAYKAMQEKLEIPVHFIHPPLKQKKEQFKLLLTSENLPDIIGSIDHLGGYPGGPDKAISDGVFIRLNELIEAYAPNYQKILEENPEFKKTVMTPEGNIYSFNMTMIDPSSPWQGMVIRSDWLNLLNHTVPETISEWETVLTDFKEKLNVEIPLNVQFDNALFRSQVFLGAWDTGFGWLNRKGEARWGPATAEYKEFLKTFKRWYEKGLLDPEFAIRHDDSIERSMITGRMGACNVYYAWFDTFLKSNEDDSRYNLSGTPYPVLYKGQSLHLSHNLPQNQNNNTVITSSCENVEEAVRFLDYGYSREGSYLLTYGLENVSYDIVEGFPYYSELMLNNSDDIPYNTIQYKYVMNHGPFLVDGYKDNAKKMPEQITKAQDLWSKSGNDWVWPNIIYSKEEAEVISKLEKEIESYSLEMTIKFIMGLEPLENWEDYQNHLFKSGLDELLYTQQNALDRFLDS